MKPPGSPKQNLGLDVPSLEQFLEDATDEEIFEAVQQMHANRENQEENNGDDDGSLAEPRPTRKEALQAVAMLSRFLEDVDGPFARMLEGSMTKFGRETRLEQSRGLVSASIAEYVAPKQRSNIPEFIALHHPQHPPRLTDFVPNSKITVRVLEESVPNIKPAEQLETGKRMWTATGSDLVGSGKRFLRLFQIGINI
ncbi:hypothetical protein B0H14DRAFT_2602839 [Mycena olivaceomarginata]|nr:hypothetical protein B0H14DRAFT_2602839 [Mycena olivaceomarginata]